MTEECIVYRIEKNGLGPYQNRTDTVWDIWPAGHRTRRALTITRPCPAGDGLHYFRPGIHMCAFESMKQLRKWFTPHSRDKLHEHGYVIAKYTANTYAIMRGGQQLAVVKEDARLVSRKPIRKAA